MKKIFFVLTFFLAFSCFSGCVSTNHKEDSADPILEVANYAALAEAGIDGTPSISENRDVGLVMNVSENGKSAVVRLNAGESVPAGTRLVLRGMDFSIHAVANVEVSERAAVGIVILCGNAVDGDLATVPGERLKAVADRMLENSKKKEQTK